MTQPMHRAGGLERQASFPHLADSLRNISDRIIERWETAVGQVLPNADGPTLARLRDNAPEILSSLANFAGDFTEPSPVSVYPGDAAAKDLPDGYRIDEALSQFSLLRQTILNELPGQMGRKFFPGEIEILTEGLDFHIRQTVIAHSEQQARELRTATESQNKYLSFLSHDLRGGLNGIFLMVEVLRRELAGRAELSGTLDDLELMRRSVLETVATMDRFLYAERFRRGKVRVKLSPFSLRTLLVEVGSRFTHAAREQGTELKIDIAEKGEIVSDRELLSLLLQSLVANAMKHTSEGSVRLAARPRQKGTGWTLEVADSGLGIEPDLLTKIHAAFQNPMPGQPGPGLGLCLTAQAARLIGATLGAESTVGVGSRFWVDVPAEANTLQTGISQNNSPGSRSLLSPGSSSSGS